MRREIALAGLATVLLWLGWLRRNEAFGLRWCDVNVTSPVYSALLDLPAGTGALQLRLKPETKSSRHRTADMWVAYTSASGLSPGT